MSFTVKITGARTQFSLILERLCSGLPRRYVDAPEIRGQCKAEKQAAQLARLFTVTALANASRIELHNIQRGKHFRILANVWLDGKRSSLRAEQLRIMSINICNRPL